MKKVVVFGGSGFLGSYVADELTNRGYSVTIADINPSKYLKLVILLLFILLLIVLRII